MPKNANSEFVELVRQAQGRIEEKLRTQSERLQKLEHAWKEFRDEHEQLKSAVGDQFAALEKFEPPRPTVDIDNVLAAVRILITATIPEQVFNAVTEEVSRMGFRAVAFEVRGKSAWGASAHGFGPELTQQALRSLAVSLTASTPFRQVFESAGPIQGKSDTLEKNRNVVNRLKPSSEDSILLLPVRSAGAVSAIVYVDSGGKGGLLPQDALQIVAEFAGAQLDRLMGLSGEGVEPEEAPDVPEHPEEAKESVEPGVAQVPAQPEAPASLEKAVPVTAPEPLPPLPAPTVAEEVAPGGSQPIAPSAELPPPPAPTEVAPATAVIPVPVIEAQEVIVAPEELPPAPAPIESAPAPAVVPVPVMEPQGVVDATPAPAEVSGSVAPQLSEADQKIHKDAKRFAKLLVSEIELYNKAKVADGRKNKDLYKRLKTDVDRSRQTYEQRFGKSVGKNFDYFHDELVRTLAVNDPSLLGSDYPGPYG